MMFFSTKKLWKISILKYSFGTQYQVKHKYAKYLQLKFPQLLWTNCNLNIEKAFKNYDLQYLNIWLGTYSHSISLTLFPLITQNNWKFCNWIDSNSYITKIRLIIAHREKKHTQEVKLFDLLVKLKL